MKTTQRFRLLSVLLAAALLFCACDSRASRATSGTLGETPDGPTPSFKAEFTLQTRADQGRLTYIGVGGEIDGVINPDLRVREGMVVRLVLINGDGMPHDLYLADFNLKTAYVSKIGDRAEIALQVGEKQPGSYVYYCTLPGHRQAGQEGRLVVLDSQPG